jgi:putative metallohydrolase (TIGR04338 family)
MADPQRRRVYAAEDAWALQLDAARRGAPRAVVAGSAVLLPAELRFGTLKAAQAYADTWADVPVRLRERKGQGQAHWEAPDVIALPLPQYGEPWALRESVLLHELAHHRAFHRHAVVDHGPSYVACMLELVAQALGEQAAFVLRVEYAEVGLV